MNLRLPTLNQFSHQLTLMAKQFNQVQTLQNQASTGKKLQKASDDPLLSERIQGASLSLETNQSYALNLSLAENRTRLIQNSLEQEGAEILRIQELILQGKNDALGTSERGLIANEIASRLETLVNLANTQDSQGQYIFSGMNAGNPAYVKNGKTYLYNGSGETTLLALSPERKVTYNESGSKAFGNFKTGNGLFELVGDPLNNQGTALLSVVNLKPNFSLDDTYKLSFLTNDSGQLSYQIIGEQGGTIIPEKGEKVPEFIPGNPISFNQLTLNVDGRPQAGDTFTLSPAKQDNLFNVLQGMVDCLSKPSDSPKDRANFHQELNNLSNSLEQAKTHFQQHSMEVASREKLIEDQGKLSANQALTQKEFLSHLSDADMAEVISDLTQQMSLLELTQQSYLKMQELFSNLYRIG